MRQGDTVKITLINNGGLDHELMVVSRGEMDDHIAMWKPGEMMTHPEPVFANAEIEDVEPGETKSTTFVADKAGSYVYACFVDEPELHAKLGMWGLFIVEASGMMMNPVLGFTISLPLLAIPSRSE